jgi:transcriptional regulator with XRE-family HTH domain
LVDRGHPWRRSLEAIPGGDPWRRGQAGPGRARRVPRAPALAGWSVEGPTGGWDTCPHCPQTRRGAAVGEEVRGVAPDFRDAGGDGALGGPVGGPEPALRGGGLPLPGLKHWRLRRGMSQTGLARRADLKDGYVARVESGRRGCNPETAQLLADLLEADLRDLRTNHDDAPEEGAPPKSARPRIAYRRVHQAYLKIILEVAVGSAYAAMEEWEIEKRCERGTWGRYSTPSGRGGGR